MSVKSCSANKQYYFDTFSNFMVRRLSALSAIRWYKHLNIDFLVDVVLCGCLFVGDLHLGCVKS